ncbi:MAG TPA: hypothetical protein VMN58_10580 [Acidimicrobiales bacterium]|nr:hypothetical protein [Acidimicrobiales bacterium]
MSTVLLAVVLAVPLLAAGATWWTPEGEAARTTVRAGGLLAAAGWLVVTLLGEVGGSVLAADGLVGPTGVGASLLLVAVTRPEERWAAVGGSLVVGVGLVGLTVGTADATPVPAVVGLGAAAAVAAAATRREGDGGLPLATAALVGAAAALLGVARLGMVVDAFVVPVSGMPVEAGVPVVVGAAAVAVAAASRPRRALGPLLPLALAVGLPAAATLEGSGEAVAVGAGALAAAAVWGVRPARRRARPLVPVALALWALAAATVPGDTTGAALLLASAAVVTTVGLRPATAVTALPGAALLVASLTLEPSGTAVALGLLGVLGVAGLVAAVAADVPPGVRGPRAASVPALGLGVWLLAVPTTWGWVGAAHLEWWVPGVVVATAGAVVGLGVAASAGWVTLPDEPALDAPDPAVGLPDDRWAWRAAVGGAVALGICGAALVASTLRLT